MWGLKFSLFSIKFQTPLNFIAHVGGVAQKENQKLIEYERYHIDVVIKNEGQINMLQTMKNE